MKLLVTASNVARKCLRATTFSGALMSLVVTVFLVSTPANAADNPNPSRITDASWWLMQELLTLEPGTRDGGIYANKPGYHNTRAANASTNYSVRDAEDKGGPSDKAAAYDWTFPEAQGLLSGFTGAGVFSESLTVNGQALSADYSNIALYSRRLLASGSDPNDPRLDGWREFYGQADNDSSVEGWDFRYDRAVSSDSSHLWHIHLSEDRDKVTSLTNKKALLSVLRGESLRDWLGKGHSVTGDTFTDVLALDPAGNMFMYPNNFGRDNGRPYSSEREQVGRGWNGYNRILPADVTGDGYTDLVALRPDSTMWLFSNNFGRDNGRPYSEYRQIGEEQNWSQYDRIMPADVTGDGHTDIIALKPDGTMWLYPNNFGRDNGKPYSAEYRQIGHGWNIYNRIMPTDVTGDGYTDLVALKPDNTMWLYPNNFGRDNGTPYGSEYRQIGQEQDWGQYNRIMPADITGDGFIDMAGLKPDGTMWLYPNNFGRDNGKPYSAEYRQIGQGWNIYDRIVA